MVSLTVLEVCLTIFPVLLMDYHYNIGLPYTTQYFRLFY